MNTQFPPTPHVARTPHPAATPFMPSVAGTAGDLCRELVARHLSFSEPERLLLKGCCYAAFATALTITGGIGMMVSAVAFPVVPTAMLLLAATTIAGIFETCSELAEHERWTADRHGVAVSRLRIQNMMLQIENHELRKFHAAGEAHSASGGSGAAVRDRGDCMSLTADAPNVLRPQFPNFRRTQ
jgi:hypothetical protein